MEPLADGIGQAGFERRAEAPAGLSALLPVFLCPVLGFLGFFVGILVGVPWDRVPILGLAMATTTLILMVFAVDRIRPSEHRNLLLTIFSFAYFVFLVLPAFVFYLGNQAYLPEYWPNPYPLMPQHVAWAMLAVLISYLVLLGGFALPFGRMAANFVPRMKREWSAETALGIALLAIPLGWMVILGSNLGVIPQRAGSGVLGTVAQGSTLGIGLIAITYMRYRSRAALLLLGFVIPPTMVFAFFTASKGAFLKPLVMLAVAHVVVTRRLRLWWILGFILLASAVYPVSMSYRIWMQENRLSAVQVIANPQNALRLMSGVFASTKPLEYLQIGLDSTARRLDAVGILSVIVRDAGTRVPYQGGWSLAYVPLSYVPRLLWPDKPLFQSGQWVTDNFGYGPFIESATGASWIGEFYFNFGWWGVFLGMAILGVWFRFIQDSFMRMDSTIPALLAGVVALMAICPNVGGDLLAPINGVVFNVVPILLMNMLVRRFTPRPRRLPPPL